MKLLTYLSYVKEFPYVDEVTRWTSGVNIHVYGWERDANGAKLKVTNVLTLSKHALFVPL